LIVGQGVDLPFVVELKAMLAIPKELVSEARREYSGAGKQILVRADGTGLTACLRARTQCSLRRAAAAGTGPGIDVPYPARAELDVDA